MDPLDVTAFRRALLAVCVLDDVDLDPADDGWIVRPVAGDPVALALAEVRAAVGGHDPEGPEAIAAVRAWLRWRLLLADDDPAALVSRARPVALPPGHLLHPGPEWVLRRVLGGALELGLGLRGRPDDPEGVGVLHPAMAVAVGAHLGAMAAHALRYLDDMGRLAASRVRRDPVAPLRPLGDCDVLTLLAAPEVRAALVATDPSGMRTAAVPMRHRGWLDLGRLDPAFALAAAVCTEPEDRGFDRPVLITRDEVVAARPGGHPEAHGAADALSRERRPLPAGRRG